MAVIKVADEVWVATAALHRRHPDREDFSVSEIVAQAEAENATGAGSLRPGVQIHAYLHCVANRRPNPARLRMLTETSRGRRRLYKPGDPCHPERRNGKQVPARNEVPAAYGELIDWYSGRELRTTRKTRRAPTRFLPCSAAARISGRMRVQMPMSGVSAKVGNEQDILGYKPLRLPV